MPDAELDSRDELGSRSKAAAGLGSGGAGGRDVHGTDK